MTFEEKEKFRNRRRLLKKDKHKRIEDKEQKPLSEADKRRRKYKHEMYDYEEGIVDI